MPESVQWKKGYKDDFRSWIFSEVENTVGDRASLERKWVDSITDWRARVIGDGTASIPFEGAADLPYPHVAMHFVPVYADLMQTLHIPRDFWTVQAIQGFRVDTAKPFQEFLSLVERNYLRMRRVHEKHFIDLILLGTGVYKDSIHHLRYTQRRYDEAGNSVKRTTLDLSPRIEHIPLQDFYIPGYASNIDADALRGAPWVAHKFRITSGQLRLHAEGQSPFLPNWDPDAVESVLKYEVDLREDRTLERQRREDEFQPFQDIKIELFEVWARFDVDGDGIEEDIRAIWHKDSNTILQDTYNPFQHGKRPFASATYMPSPGFYGIGMGESEEWAQLALTRLLNNAVNNTLLVNMRMFGVPFGANISPDEPLFSGKIWPLGPNEKIQEIKLGEVYPSMFQMMQMIQQWAELQSGVSDLRTGDISSLPSRTPASTVLSMLQESNKRFDMVLANLRDGALAELGQRVVQNLCQITQTDPRWIAFAYQTLGDADGAKVAEILQSPVEDIEERLGVSVTATSSQSNKAVEQQTFASVAQFIAQLYPSQIQYANMLAQSTKNPQILLETVQAAYTGQNELLKRMLEAFDIQNSELFLPSAGAQMPMGQQMPPAAPPPTAPLGGPGGPGPFAQAPGLLGSLLGAG